MMPARPALMEAWRNKISTAERGLEPVTATTEFHEPGTEPTVVIFLDGGYLATFRRDDFLDLVYLHAVETCVGDLPDEPVH